jgi:hypothetical protein
MVRLATLKPRIRQYTIYNMEELDFVSEQAEESMNSSIAHLEKTFLISEQEGFATNAW